MIPKLVMCQELAVYYMQFVISDFVKKNKWLIFLKWIFWIKKQSINNSKRE
jgi:hypothetical protein